MHSKKNQYIIAAALVVFAASMKALTHPFTIDPIIAISLFSGAVISDRKLAFLMPLAAMFASDVILEIFKIDVGFYGISQIGNYASLLLITVIGFGMKNKNAFSVLAFSLLSSIAFFFLSNTNCFLFDGGLTYSKDLAGWAQCLTAGIPFIKNGLIIDLAFSSLLFGTYALVYGKSMNKAQA